MPPAICAISSSPGLTLPRLHRRSSWRQVKSVPLQRVQCTPNANNTEILLRGKTSTDIVKLLLPDEEPSAAASDAASDGTIDTTAEPIESEPEPEPLKLKPLPYAFNALEPYMSKETVQYHWERHQQSHVDSLNEHIKGTAFAGMELKDIMLGSYNEGNPLPFFPDAAQVWNHEFFWESMKPRGGGTLSGILKYLIKRDFGSLAGLTREMQKAALTQFGSGWVWLAFKVHRLGVGNDINPRPSDKDKKLVVAKTPNAVNPLVWGYYPLIAIDVWEHAYYMDYENRRGDYVSVFMKNLVSWDMVSSRLDNALKAAVKREKFEKKKLLWKKMHEQTPQVSSLSLRPETAKRPKRRRG